MLFEPPPSPGDLHFRVFGVPVRVHPLFWFATILLGLNGGERGTPPAELLIWVVVVFASILVHELGHAAAQRHFGGHPWITLHAFGGLASCDDCDRRPRSQILISLAGPAAGFLLAIALLAMLRGTGHNVALTWGDASVPGMERLYLPFGAISWAPLSTDNANDIVRQLFWINILWGLVNLLPIYPLDGGRVAREILTLGNPRKGIALSLRISMVAAALFAAYGLLALQSWFAALFFGYLAYSSYRTLAAYQAAW